MHVSTESLFGGGLSWDKVSRKDFAEEAEIDPSTLSRIKAGKEGFGPNAARKAADVTGEDAASIYLVTQTHSIKVRRGQGDLDDGGTLKAVGRILSTLKAKFPNAQIPDEYAKALQDLAAEASQSEATPASQMAALGRDGSGQRISKRQGTTAEKSVPGIYGKLGRNADGTSRRKVV